METLPSNEDVWKILTTEDKIIQGIAFDYYKYNKKTDQMEYHFPADNDAMIYIMHIVSKGNFLKRNLEKFVLR